MNLDEAEKEELKQLLLKFMKSRMMATTNLEMFKVNAQIVVRKQGQMNEDIYVSADIQAS